MKLLTFFNSIVIGMIVFMNSAQADLDRVDSLLDAAESVQHAVDGVGQLTRDSVATPLIKARAFVAGTSQAARRLGRPNRARG